MTKPVCEEAVLIDRKDLKHDYYSVTLRMTKRAFKCLPGQFVHLKIPCIDIYFRRAFSIAGIGSNGRDIEIIFKVFGRGTKVLKNLRKKESLSLLGPLGAPFTLPKKKEETIIVAGGVGFPPLLYLAEHMISKGFDPGSIHFFYGGKTSSDIVERSRIKKLGVVFRPVTDDGSFGTKGLVTEAVEKFLNESGSRGSYRMYGCGPGGMLKATDALGLKYGIPGQVSLEAPMPCGLGICLGCVVPLRQGGHARVCREGPVFDIGEVLL